MTKQPLKNAIFSCDSVTSVKPQFELRQIQKEQRRRTSRLLQTLGKGITAAQVKRLDTLNLQYCTLQKIHDSAADDAEFQGALLALGVQSRPLRE